MFTIASIKTSILQRRALRLLPLALALGAGAAQAGAVSPTGYNVSYVLCRSDAHATQYTELKGGGWMSLTDTGKSLKYTLANRDDWSVYLNASNGLTSVQLDLFAAACKTTTVSTGTVTSLGVDTAAALMP